MDFFNSLAGGNGKNTPTDDKAGEDKPSSEVMSDAKVVAAAAQSAANKQYEEIDKGRVAGSGADILEAGKNYGKLGEEGAGKYVDQAHDYLEKYSQSNTAPAKGGIGANSKPESGKEEEKPTEAPAIVPEATEKPESGKDEEKSPADYMKMAQGFLGK